MRKRRLPKREKTSKSCVNKKAKLGKKSQELESGDSAFEPCDSSEFIQEMPEPAQPCKPDIIGNPDHIKDLQSFLELYKYNVTNLNVNKIAYQNVEEPLRELNEMIGLKKFKLEVLGMVLYYLKNVPEKFTQLMQGDVPSAKTAVEPMHLPIPESESDNSNSEELSDSFIIEDDLNSEDEEVLRQYVRGLTLSLFRIPENQSAKPEMPKWLINADNEKLDQEEINMISNVISRLDMLHTAITGPPGVGKTMAAKIVGKIYAALGFLQPGKFRKVNATHFTSKWVGETSEKTQQLCMESLGGVLFFDEAYSLDSNNEKHRDLGQKVADVFTDVLAEHKHDFVMIVAGYKRQLETRFFGLNPGLGRRFQWRFHIDKYSALELKQIFVKMALEKGFCFAEEVPVEWFARNYNYFTNYGGSMETLLTKVKYEHNRRVIFLPDDQFGKITMIDMNAGLNKYIDHSDCKKSAKETEIIRSYFC